MKYIVVECCQKCQHRNWDFARGAYCTCLYKLKTIRPDDEMGNFPNWCPLDEYKKDELLKAAKKVIVWHVNTPGYFDKTEGFGKDLDKLKNVIRKIEGDTE